MVIASLMESREEISIHLLNLLGSWDSIDTKHNLHVKFMSYCLSIDGRDIFCSTLVQKQVHKLDAPGA